MTISKKVGQAIASDLGICDEAPIVDMVARQHARASANVATYIATRLGIVPPRAGELAKFPIGSPCGLECADLVDLAAEMSTKMIDANTTAMKHQVIHQ